ncbi:MAG: AbrB/MazE/SpoVT family DNA-binding domain-containing protein [Ignisphaera sp.]|nr:AbrB/MazE/SpoVT family DNA-binding domain-containing protein [Ignisphaera sp.]
MYTEIVKVDAKGRVTIPSSVRLLLDIEEGDQLLLIVDEEHHAIKLQAFKNDSIVICKMMINAKSINEIFSSLANKIINFSCLCIDEACEAYRCKLVVPSDVVEKILNIEPSALCTNTAEAIKKSSITLE